MGRNPRKQILNSLRKIPDVVSSEDESKNSDITEYSISSLENNDRSSPMKRKVGSILDTTLSSPYKLELKKNKSSDRRLKSVMKNDLGGFINIRTTKMSSKRNLKLEKDIRKHKQLNENSRSRRIAVFSLNPILQRAKSEQENNLDKNAPRVNRFEMALKFM